MSADKTLRQRQGSNFLSLINDLKRNRQAAADDLGVALADIERIIAGEIDIPEAVLRAAAERWPVNRRDFMVVEDDAPEGVRLMSAEESAATSRVFSRGGRPYYEYRDTAMSRVAPFRPEWILELAEVDDDDPANPLVQWNNGHFMHQFTLFVNAVNFYYIENGARRVMRAHTGDSMYITPFVPHTFTTRRGDAERLYGGRKGLILALTYGNKLVGDVQHELSALGGDLPRGLLLDTSSREAYAASLLRQQAAAMSMSDDDLAALSGIAPARLAELLAGRALAAPEENAVLAAALAVESRDLLPPDAFDPPVVTRRIADAAPRRFGDYTVTDLAGSRHLPHSKALLLEAPAAARTPLKFLLHEYLYNLGEETALLRWQGPEGPREAELAPGASAYVKPSVAHELASAGSAAARLLSLRIGGKGVGDAQREFSRIGPKNARRVYDEHTLWYREEGK